MSQNEKNKQTQAQPNNSKPNAGSPAQSGSPAPAEPKSTDTPKPADAAEGKPGEQPAAPQAPAAPAADPVKENPPTAATDKVEERVKGPHPDRQLPKKLVEHIDAKLKDNGLAQHALAKKDARTLMRLAAESLVGVREHGGNNRGVMVELIQDVIGEHGEYWPWCMSFVQVCIAYAELKTGILSPIHVHEHVITVWQKTDKKHRCNVEPLPGAIVIWKHPDGVRGHAGILTSIGPVNITCIEGNTEAGVNPQGKIERDGGGIYATERNKNGTGDLRIQGYLRPF